MYKWKYIIWNKGYLSKIGFLIQNLNSIAVLKLLPRIHKSILKIEFKVDFVCVCSQYLLVLNVFLMKSLRLLSCPSHFGLGKLVFLKMFVNTRAVIRERQIGVIQTYKTNKLKPGKV